MILSLFQLQSTHHFSLHLLHNSLLISYHEITQHLFLHLCFIPWFVSQFQGEEKIEEKKGKMKKKESWRWLITVSRKCWIRKWVKSPQVNLGERFSFEPTIICKVWFLPSSETKLAALRIPFAIITDICARERERGKGAWDHDCIRN